LKVDVAFENSVKVFFNNNNGNCNYQTFFVKINLLLLKTEQNKEQKTKHKKQKIKNKT